MMTLATTPLTTQQKNTLQVAVDKANADGNYSAAYEALKNMLPADRYNTHAWLDVAKATNGNDHGFIDTSLRSITQSSMLAKGLGDYSESKFKQASNELAKSLFDKILAKSEIPDIQQISTMDSKAFSAAFNLPDGAWPGSVIDGFVLGDNWVVADNGSIVPIVVGGLATLGQEQISAAQSLLNKIFKLFKLDVSLGGSQATFTKNDLALLKDLMNGTGANIWESILDTSPALKSLLEKLKDQAESTISPLVLDLNGDGISTVSLTQGIYFDHAADGFAEKTGWINNQDGFLVRDINGNGQIDSGRELFGSETLLSNGSKAVNGFEALAELDSNHDNVFSQDDASFNQLRIWRDSNTNGRVENGELLTLQQANVKSIGLNHSSQYQQDESGNVIGEVGHYTTSQDQVLDIQDIWFSVDNMDSQSQYTANLPADIAQLPDLQAIGHVVSLRQAMATETTGQLKTLVQQFIAESDYSQRGVHLNKRQKSSVGFYAKPTTPRLSLAFRPPIFTLV
jgi:hypothetical protein